MNFYGTSAATTAPDVKDEAVRVIVRIRPPMEQCLNPDLHYIAPHQGICAEAVDVSTIKLMQLHYCTCEYCRNNYGAEVRTEHYTIRKDKEDKLFKFNRVYQEDTTQEDMFEDIASFVDAAIDGYASTIIAYGPPSGGKTFTMTGNYYEAGIIPRAIDMIFDKLTTLSNENMDNIWEIEMSYVEFYNNNFRNLLRDDLKPANSAKDRLFFGYNNTVDTMSEADDRSVSHPKVCSSFDTPIIMHGDKIEIRESPIIGAFLAAPSIRYQIKTAQDAINLIAKGDKMRTFSSNSNNESTTRGHAIVTMYVETKLVKDIPKESYFVKGLLKLGKIHLVDLASGERVKDSNASGDSLVEAQFINRSLLALGEVLHALSVNASLSRKRQKISSDEANKTEDEHNLLPSTPISTPAAKLKDLHVPYFDSKFTHLLRDSFGGNGKSTMIVSIPPERQYYHQNVQALQFALRARKVLNFPEVNKLEITADVVIDPNSELSIIQQLKQKLLEPLMREAAKNGYRRAVNTPYASMRPKSFNFIIKNMIVEDIPYVSFPLQPWLRLETAGVVQKTTKQQYYTNRATFQEEFNFEIDALDYEEGEEVEVRVFSVIPYRHKWELGRTKFILAKSFPVMEEKIKLSFPFYQLVDDEIKQQGQLLISGITKPSFSSRASIFDMPTPRGKFQTPSKPSRGITGPSTASKMTSAMKSDQATAAANAADLNFDANKKYVLAVKKFATADAHINVQEGSDGSGNYKFFLEAKFGSEVIKTGAQSGKTRYRGKEKVATINFDDPNVRFDVNGGQVRHESIHLLLYVKPSNDAVPQVIGRIIQPVNSMFSKQGDDVVVDFHCPMRDISNKPSGKVSFGLQLLPTSLMKKPVQVVDENANQELSGARLPDDFIFGWVRISTIEGVGLNTLKLLGKHARYIDQVDDPHFLESVKQDLMVVVEFGEKWTSKTCILGDQEDCCMWNNANFRIFTSKEDLIREPVKFSVFNMRATGKDKLVGTSVVPLHRLCEDKTLSIRNVSLPLKNRKGKTNGKLIVNGAVLKDKGDSWIPAVIVACHHDGTYDVQYEDNEIEPRVSKDLLIPHHRHNASTASISEGAEASDEAKANNADDTDGAEPSPAKSVFKLGGKLKPRFVVGAKVEVQFGGRDLWYPAVIAADHNNGFYNLDSTYEIPKSNIHETLIRPIAISPVKTKPVVNPNRVIFAVGDKLEANYKMKGKYYPATVWKVQPPSATSEDGGYTYDVDYESGVREYALTEDKVRPLANSGSGKLAVRTSSDFDLTASVKTPLQNKVGGKSKFASSPDLNKLLTASRGNMTPMPTTPKQSPMPRSPQKSPMPTNTSTKLDSTLEDSNRWEESDGTYQVGDRVEANYRQSGDFYPAFIQEVQEENTYAVLFDGGEIVSNVEVNDIRPLVDKNAQEGGDIVLNEADNKYSFQVGEHVEANHRGLGKWYSGTIKRKRGGGLFDIQYDDGKHESKVYGDQIRIFDVELDQGYKYQVGDQVEVNSGGAGYWYPANIIKHRGGNCYDVEFDDHEKECFVMEKFLRYVPPSSGDGDQVLMSDKPKYAKGDYVLVKSRSKAVEAQIKLYGELKDETHIKLEELFALLRKVEEEESHLQWARTKTSLQSKSFLETKQDIAGILEGEEDNDAEEDDEINSAALKALQTQLHAQENAVEFARKLVSKQWGKVEDLQSSLQQEVSGISSLDKKLSSQSQTLTQANRSGLEEAEMYSITEALEDVRMQLHNIAHAVSTSKEAVKWIVSATHNCEEETMAISAADVVAKKLLEALVTKAQAHDDALDEDQEDGSDAGYDAARHGVEVGYDGIYGGSEDAQDEDDEVMMMVGHDHVKDMVKSTTAERRDSVLSPKFDMEVNPSAKTMLGQILIKRDVSSGKDVLDMLHHTPAILQRSFSRKRSSRGTVTSKLIFLCRYPAESDSNVVHNGSKEAMSQLGYANTDSPSDNEGSRELSFTFEVGGSHRRSRRLLAPLATSSMNLRPMSPMEDPRLRELRRLIAEKKTRADAAQLEYYRKNHYQREQELYASIQGSIDDFIHTYHMQDVLENKGSSELDNYRNEVIEHDLHLKQSMERKQECEQVAVAAKQHAEECEAKLAQDEVLMLSVEEQVKQLEATKLAYVEAWSRWEEAKFMIVLIKQCYHQVTHASTRRLKELSHIRHKLKDMLQEYEELRIARIKQVQQVLQLRSTVEEKRQRFFEKKEQLERDSMAHERLNKRLNDVAFSSKLLARTGGGGYNSTNPTPKSSFRRGSSLYDGAKPVEDVNDLFADIGAIKVEDYDEDEADSPSKGSSASPAVFSPMKSGAGRRASLTASSSYHTPALGQQQPSFSTPRTHHTQQRRTSITKKGFFAFDPKEVSQEIAKQRGEQEQCIQGLHQQVTNTWNEIRFEDHFWFKNETVAFDGSVQDPATTGSSATASHMHGSSTDDYDNVPGSIQGLELVHVEALLLAKTHMKKTIQLRSDVEELLEKQLEALALIMTLMENEHNNYTLAMQSLVSESELLTQARYDIEIEVRHESSQIKAKQHLIHLYELQDKIVALRQEIDRENKVVEEEKQAYDQALNSYTNVAMPISPKKATAGTATFEGETSAKDTAMANANQHQIMMFTKQQCLHDEAIKRIAKEFHAQLLLHGSNNNPVQVVNGSTNSNEIDHALLSEVNLVYDDEHTHALAAIYHAEQQVKSLEEVKAHAKHEQQAFQRQRLDYLKTLFGASSNKYQESYGKMKQEDEDIKQANEVYRQQCQTLAKDYNDVVRRMSSYQDALNKLKHGNQYLQSKDYQQLQQSYQHALAKVQRLQKQRAEEEQRCRDIHHHRDNLQRDIYPPHHDHLLAQIENVHKMHQHYEHHQTQDLYDRYLAQLMEVMDTLTSQQTTINIIRNAQQQESSQQHDIQEKIMTEEVEAVRLLQGYADEVSLKMDIETKKSKCKTGLGSLFVASHQFEPQAASSAYMKRLHAQRAGYRRLQHLMKTIKPFPWISLDSKKEVVKHDEKKVKLSALGYHELDEARSKVILTKEVLRFEEQNTLFDLKSCSNYKKILPHPPHSGYLPLYMASKAKMYNTLLTSAPKLSNVPGSAGASTPSIISPSHASSNGSGSGGSNKSESIEQGFVQNSKKSLTRTFSMMGSKNTVSSYNGFGNDLASSATSSGNVGAGAGVSGAGGSAGSVSSAMSSISENDNDNDSEIIQELRRLELKLQKSHQVEDEELVPFEYQINQELVKMSDVIHREHDSFDADELAKQTVLDDAQLAEVLAKIRSAGSIRNRKTIIEEEKKLSKKTVVEEETYRVTLARS